MDGIADTSHPVLLTDIMNTLLIPKQERVEIYRSLLAECGIQADGQAIADAFQQAREQVELPLLHGVQPSMSERTKWSMINARIVQGVAPNSQQWTSTSGMRSAEAIGEWLFEQISGNASFYQLPSSVGRFLSYTRRMGIRIIGASNQEPKLLHKLLIAFGLHGAFDGLAISDDMGYAKPDPRYFESVLRQAQALPSDAAFMGNNPLNDMIGAHTAGITKLILLDYASTLPDAPYYVHVSDPMQAIPYLREWFRINLN